MICKPSDCYPYSCLWHVALQRIRWAQAAVRRRQQIRAYDAKRKVSRV